MSGLIGGLICDYKYSENIEEIMKKSLEKYKIDRLNKIKDENYFMLCGLQFVTEENKTEVIPYKEDKLIITGDIILDNREELFKIFEIADEKKKYITDTYLVIEAYKKWGYNCPDYLLGDFSFVIYDERKKEIFCVRDHMGCRPFYYIKKEGLFAFSSITSALIPLTDNRLNERWITDFLSILGAMNNSEPVETIYEDILQLPPAHVMIVRQNEIIKKKYWDPVNKVKPLKLKSHKEYVDRFLEIFEEAVKCKLRTSYDVGILVSGGLDSGSVAAIASKELKKEDKVLKGFSFVPLKGFAEKSRTYRMVDESDYVKKLSNKCGNMEVEFCRNEGINSMTNIDETIETYEQPIKTIQNSYWIDEITKKCAQNNIKVLLGGQFGNATISFGDFTIHMNELLDNFKISELIDEINCASKMYKIPRKYLCRIIIKNKIPNSVKKFLKRKENTVENRFMYNPINPKMLDKWNVAERFDKKGYNVNFDRFFNLKESRKMILDENGLSHISIMLSKYPMKYGVIRRDPTKDKRIVEFCMSIPSSEYVHKGEERYLIRSAMKDILPEEIRTNWKHRGLQSADWVQRLKPDWYELHRQIENSLEDIDMKKYMDIYKIRKYLNKNREISDDTNSSEIYCLLLSLIMYKFFLQHRQSVKYKAGNC